MFFAISFALGISCLLIGVSGHGRMIDPPQRSTLWRVYPGQGFEPNYNDNELFCGGFAIGTQISSETLVHLTRSRDDTFFHLKEFHNTP